MIQRGRLELGDDVGRREQERIGRRVRSSDSFFVAGRSLGPGRLFATLLAAIASANGCINDAARAWFSLGRDRYLPAWFLGTFPDRKVILVVRAGEPAWCEDADDGERMIIDLDSLADRPTVGKELRDDRLTEDDEGLIVQDVKGAKGVPGTQGIGTRCFEAGRRSDDISLPVVRERAYSRANPGGGDCLHRVGNVRRI